MWEMQQMNGGSPRHSSNHSGQRRGRPHPHQHHGHHNELTSNASDPPPHAPPPGFPATSEDLHAWSIYRQNLNSDFTDSALGSSEKSPMPYGNFHLRETTMQSILNNPKYGPKSELGTNMYTYLKFGLPRVVPSNGKIDGSSGYDSTDEEGLGSGRGRFNGGLRAARSEDFLGGRSSRSRGYNPSAGARTPRQASRFGGAASGGWAGSTATNPRAASHAHSSGKSGGRGLKSSVSEANLLQYEQELKRYRSSGHLEQQQRRTNHLSNGAFVNRGLEVNEESLDDDEDDDVTASDSEGGGVMDDELLDEEELDHRSTTRLAKAASRLSVNSRHSRATHLANGQGVSYRNEAPMLNDKYFPRDFTGSSYHAHSEPAAVAEGYKYPHLQLRNVCFDAKRGRGGKNGRGRVGGTAGSERILDGITMEARGGELVAVMSTKSEFVPNTKLFPGLGTTFLTACSISISL